jgi:dTDP-4-amino-4,6-dideoxygalactose transaminase
MSGDERFYVGEAFNSNYIAPLGPQVDAFEKEFCQIIGIKHAVALNSGTAAIHIALRLIGVEAGDEVFASTLTFVGSVTPVTFQGAMPVFIDCDKQSWNMNPDLLEREMELCAKKNNLPKAVISTDLYGQCANMERILGVCDEYGVPVICDSAEALGASYKKSAECRVLNDEWKNQSDDARASSYETDERSCELAHAGVGAKAAIYSFNGNKIITTSGGGMLVSDDEVFIEKARFLSQQARDPFPHYEHSEIGYNYRMSNILAAIGRGQLRVLKERVARKREIFDYYKDALGDLPGIEFMPEASYGRCTRWLTVTLITPELFGVDRESVRLVLEEENIESRPVWKPMHLQPVFHNSHKDVKTQSGKKRYPCRVVGGAVAEDLFERGLCLPSGTAITRGDLERVIGVIRRMHRR